MRILLSAFCVLRSAFSHPPSVICHLSPSRHQTTNTCFYPPPRLSLKGEELWLRISLSAFCSWPSAFRLPPSAFSFPPSAFRLQLSAFSFPPSAFRLQLSAFSFPPSAFSLPLSALRTFYSPKTKEPLLPAAAPRFMYGLSVSSSVLSGIYFGENDTSYNALENAVGQPSHYQRQRNV